MHNLCNRLICLVQQFVFTKIKFVKATRKKTCEWEVKTDCQAIKITFDYFSMEKDYDTLEILDDGKVIYIDSDAERTLQASEFTVVFNSDYIVHLDGFKLGFDIKNVQYFVFCLVHE